MNGRSFWQLTNEVPGVTYTPGGQNTNTGGSTIRSSAVAVNVNGGPPDQTGWMLDGAFITEMQNGGTMIQPDIDAVPAQYTYGTPLRNTLRADNLNELDFTLLKTFPLGEARSLEFRGEFFNLANHPTFAAPSTSINSGSGAQASATLNSSREVQLGVSLLSELPGVRRRLG